MRHEIRVRLSTDSITQAERELQAYKQRIADKTDMLVRRLAVLGFQSANVRFQTAAFEPDSHDFTIDVQPTKTGGWEILANGKDVCFIEFGAGVYYNGAESYQGERPAGVVGIGQYGKGHGAQEAWYYSGGLTHGTPANAPMFYTAQEMRQSIMKIAREVFAA